MLKAIRTVFLTAPSVWWVLGAITSTVLWIVVDWIKGGDLPLIVWPIYMLCYFTGAVLTEYWMSRA